MRSGELGLGMRRVLGQISGVLCQTAEAHTQSGSDSRLDSPLRRFAQGVETVSGVPMVLVGRLARSGCPVDPKPWPWRPRDTQSLSGGTCYTGIPEWPPLKDRGHRPDP